MLTKQHRLQKNKDFELIFKRGKTFSSKLLFLKVKKNNLEVSRFGFIIGTKTSKKSTVRNKLKRRLREIVRRRLGALKSGFDVIIGVKPEIVGKNYRETKEELEGLLKKAGLLKL